VQKGESDCADVTDSGKILDSVVTDIRIGKTLPMPTLELSANDFRRLAARVTEVATGFLGDLDKRDTVSTTSSADTSQAFDLPLLEEGIGEAVIDDLVAIAEHVRAPTGRRLPYVIGSGEAVGALADFYASVLNQNVTAWRSAPAAVTVERTVIGWLAGAIGCEGFVGSFTNGASLANLMALAMARESRARANERGSTPGVVYASEEVHMSIPKAVALLGLGTENLRLIPVRDDMRIDLEALERAIAADREAGQPRVALVGSAGTIMSGAIDPLAELAELARAHDLWFHVDGAYGVPAALVEPAKFEGLALADSISLDAHKWLYQPLDCSVLLYRNPEAARAAFSFSAEYVKTSSDDPVEGFAFFDQTIELSRRFRALKVWLSLRYHGLGAFRAAIAENLTQAQTLAHLIESEASLDLLAPVELSAVCFRWVQGDPRTLNERNELILRRVNERGRVWLSNASIHGEVGLRACITNHRTTDEDIRVVVDEVMAAAGDTA
jgi:glutamate/tyrosine decarboxylase-like PLP-dependent enzyme